THDQETEDVRPNRATPAPERCPNQHWVISGRAAPFDGARVVPRHADVVEHRAFDRWEAHRQEAEYQTACQREPQLHVADRDLRSDQLVERGASGLRTRLRGDAA